MSQNSQRIHQETRRKIPKILQKTQGAQGGSESKDRGVYSNKTQETERNPKKHNETRPTPTDLMDPDQSNTPGALD